MTHYSFELNPIQRASLPYIERDVNIVVSSPTATGKTLIAELVYQHHLANNGKCLYVSPLRSLSMQKQEAWDKDDRFANYFIVASTGDVRSNPETIAHAHILVMTVESLDAKTRNHAHREWIEKASCLVIDEAHTMGQDGRGDKLESALLRFSSLNKTARLILLSGTMSNTDAVASWIKSLNGKETIKISSKWRPSKMNVNVSDMPDKWADRITSVCELVSKNKSGEKTIIFVHSKSMGKDIIKSMRNNGIRCAFHNAGLSRSMRSKVEQVFDSPISGVDVLVSTSTLSAGINIGV